MPSLLRSVLILRVCLVLRAIYDYWIYGKYGIIGASTSLTAPYSGELREQIENGTLESLTGVSAPHDYSGELAESIYLNKLGQLIHNLRQTVATDSRGAKADEYGNLKNIIETALENPPETVERESIEFNRGKFEDVVAEKGV